ncbi:PadR family transcriptional regulator [Rhizobium sp. C4]|uniref:PadR family transcriptional regulator n=1 Tax=Rhizobium sp. C4 TaxID=1349800 RepID=UPI001E4BEC05|nr:PadR family transcriptional regulator [Rhizobium sp. C4]MCD2176191.1 PadR family transcriptional regulator [Rhizobium sp. C4]
MQEHFHGRHDRDRHHGEGRRGGGCGDHGEGRHFGKREKMIAMMLMGRGPFGRGFMGEGGGRGPGRGGFGGGDDGFGPRGRSLGQGHIRLLVLSLIEAEPRHGYDLIKQIEEMSGGAYAPSPGVIYPTLTLLEEAGYAATTSEGNKKLYTITPEGKAHLDESRDQAAMIVERLKALGEHMKEREERHGRGRHDGPELPRGVDAAFLNLREAVARKLGKDEAAATEIVRKLLAMAEELG